MAEEDVIFGKNRHFFGGMEPSNMLKFEVGSSDDAIRLDAQLPNDTIIDGQTLCTVAGAIIRRKTTGFPVDEFDGEFVADITTSGVIVDETADPLGTYYYAAFPYTTQGVYSISPLNQAVTNEPEPMVSFTAKSGIGTVILTADLPEGVVGAVIRKSTAGYPSKETDGEELVTLTEDGTYVDTDVESGVTYYYAAFPYSSTLVYNRSESNRASVTVKAYEWLFGYDLDLDDSDPSTRVSYPSDVDNANFTKFTLNNYGSWNFAPGEKFMPKPCMLNHDGTVAYYLNPNNYRQKEDGSSFTSGSGLSSDFMMEWPKIYAKRWEENGVYHFRCSDSKIDDDYECWCNYDKNNNEIDHFYTSIYEGCVTGGKLRSINGYSVTESVSYNSFVSNAQALGSDWHIHTLADHLLIQDLLVMMAKTTNSQTAYGQGYTGMSYREYIDNGTMDTNGMFWGSTSNTVGCKVFGMENYWGNIPTFVAGWIMQGGIHYVKLTRGTRDGSTASDYNGTGSGYIVINDVSALPGSFMGYKYVSKTVTKPYGRLPCEANGSTTTYECDGGGFNYQSTYVYIVSVGGNYSETQTAGLFAFENRSTASEQKLITNARLSCKPSAT